MPINTKKNTKKYRNHQQEIRKKSQKTKEKKFSIFGNNPEIFGIIEVRYRIFFGIQQY